MVICKNFIQEDPYQHRVHNKNLLMVLLPNTVRNYFMASSARILNKQSIKLVLNITGTLNAWKQMWIISISCSNIIQQIVLPLSFRRSSNIVRITHGNFTAQSYAKYFESESSYGHRVILRHQLGRYLRIQLKGILPAKDDKVKAAHKGPLLL